jgi:malonate transporter
LILASFAGMSGPIMLATLEILFPVFGLILAGFICRRRGVLGPTACSELNKFVVWLALPALLFQSMSHATWQQLDQPGFAAAFGLACAAVFVLTLVWRLYRGSHLADASVEAIAASYSNTGYIGFPLCLVVFGNASLAPTTIATLLVVSVLFAIGILLIEVGLQTERVPHRLGWKVLRALLRNPLILSPLAGAAMAASGQALPGAVDSFLKLLGAAASPCALVCLGLFLAEKRPVAARQPGSVLLTMGKLVLQPALTWWLAVRVFQLPSPLAQMAVLLAALPTGTGPFMLAEFYRREAYVTSRTILLSTMGSLLTLTLLLLHMARAA